ncbi:hypothetical protein HYALB_00003319 [Hymenoscyphus albidus]|uniref:PEBP-like protein n=1 Tax=Hymenoscyphus albidus TaxID=595503 RepID=A0A9N9LG45_9HELO|nr:hypothetical protein HYALB_00003319 [Hymenoscyphus albidus]
MLSSYIVALAMAGAVNAATPAGFEPAATADLFVAFGQKAAVNGVLIPRADTARIPVIGTKEKLVGTYAIIMTDPDIPGAPADGKTGQFLHWLQTDLVSAETATTIGGQQIFLLTNSTAPAAAYVQPSPPNRVPVSHRYVELLINTTGSSVATTMLNAAGKTRTGFSALQVVNQAAAQVIAGNFFNVTNEQALGGGTGGRAAPSGAALPTGTARPGSGTGSGNAGRAGASGAPVPTGTGRAGSGNGRADSTAGRAAPTNPAGAATPTTGGRRPSNSTSTNRPVSTGAATSMSQDNGLAMFAGLVAMIASFAML